MSANNLGALIIKMDAVRWPFFIQEPSVYLEYGGAVLADAVPDVG
jgi:hypothetical protein